MTPLMGNTLLSLPNNQMLSLVTEVLLLLADDELQAVLDDMLLSVIGNMAPYGTYAETQRQPFVNDMHNTDLMLSTSSEYFL